MFAQNKMHFIFRKVAKTKRKHIELNTVLLLLFCSNNISVGPMNSSDAGGNGGGELFEKFQRQKLNRETAVLAGVMTDT